jgi:hypothetical protein
VSLGRTFSNPPEGSPKLFITHRVLATAGAKAGGVV